MDKKNFAFDKTNFILLAAGMVVIIIGFLLMTGPGSTETTFEPDISVCGVSRWLRWFASWDSSL